MRRSLIGPTLREQRRALGITQSKLAADVGISASYLNLIEANKRDIGGLLLKRLAEALGLEIDVLDGAAERRLVDDLGQIGGEPLLADLHLDPAAIHALVSRHGDWARALVRLHRAWLDRGRAVSALSDRLNRDPFLGSAVHSLRSQVAAIRSSAEILQTVDDLEPAQRQRFVTIVGEESALLTDLSQALATFLEKDYRGARSLTPVDEVDDFIFDHDNHFPELEQAANDLRASAGIVGECSEAMLAGYLQRTHSVRIDATPAARLDPVAASAAGGFEAGFDPVSRTLVLSEAGGPGRRFRLARLAAELFRQGHPIDVVLARSAQLTTDDARRHARHVLSSYLAAAVLLPYETFLKETLRLRYDIEQLAQRFGASFEQTCHRLATLRRPGAAGIPFGLMRTDASGFTDKRFPLQSLAMPRHGPACPMWALYQAFQVPGTLVRQLVELPGGERLLFVARTVEKPRPGFGLPRRFLSVMLACDALHADQTVYGDGLDLRSSAPAVPVGPCCRLCVRRDCRYRQEEPILSA